MAGGAILLRNGERQLSAGHRRIGIQNDPCCCGGGAPGCGPCLIDTVPSALQMNITFAVPQITNCISNTCKSDGGTPAGSRQQLDGPNPSGTYTVPWVSGNTSSCNYRLVDSGKIYTHKKSSVLFGPCDVLLGTGPLTITAQLSKGASSSSLAIQIYLIESIPTTVFIGVAGSFGAAPINCLTLQNIQVTSNAACPTWVPGNAIIPATAAVSAIP